MKLKILFLSSIVTSLMVYFLFIMHEDIEIVEGVEINTSKQKCKHYILPDSTIKFHSSTKKFEAFVLSKYVESLDKFIQELSRRRKKLKNVTLSYEFSNEGENIFNLDQSKEVVLNIQSPTFNYLQDKVLFGYSNLNRISTCGNDMLGEIKLDVITDTIQIYKGKYSMCSVYSKKSYFKDLTIEDGELTF